MKFPLVGQAYENRSLAVSAQECVNLYPESVESEGRANATLHGTPGQKLFVNVGTGPIRGMRVADGILYVVSGTFLYSVDSLGAIVSLGTIAGAEIVSMAHNYREPPSGAGIMQLCIVNGTDGYIYDLTNGLVKILDVNFNPANIVAFMDGYFIFNWNGTHKFFSSVLNDGTTYIATDFGEKLTFSDDVVSIIQDHKELWVFGEFTIEIWFNEGAGAGFAFSKIESAYIERGCAAKHGIAKVDNTIYWLGDDLIVYRAEGYNPVRISTHAIEFAIKKYSRVDDAFAFEYTDEGHKFYVLTFPSGSTWVFDIATKMWHERRTFGLDRWGINAYAPFLNKHFVGDYLNGNIYELDLDVYTDNGVAIQRRRATTYVHAESDPVYLDWLQIVIESGAGLTVGQGDDPQAMLQYSDDSGKTWSNEKWRSMGKIGEYFRRVRWTRLGRFYQRIFRIVISDPIKVVITEADVFLTKGSR